jgi:hypothetical protein
MPESLAPRHGQPVWHGCSRPSGSDDGLVRTIYRPDCQRELVVEVETDEGRLDSGRLGHGTLFGRFLLDLRTTIGAVAWLPFDPDQLVKILCETGPTAANNPTMKSTRHSCGLLQIVSPALSY